MNNLLSVLLVAIGLINFIPIVGVLSASKLEQSYKVSLDDANLLILMRHRALLFGIIGGYILFSAFVEAHQLAAMVMAAISMTGFLALVWLVGDYNTALKKVAVVDVIGLALLAAAVVIKTLF